MGSQRQGITRGPAGLRPFRPIQAERPAHHNQAGLVPGHERRDGREILLPGATPQRLQWTRDTSARITDGNADASLTHIQREYPHTSSADHCGLA